MRSRNLRAAPRWITPEMVGRILALSIPVEVKTVPVRQVPTRGVKPALAIVEKSHPNTPKSPAEHARRSEEREAANAPAASPRRKQDAAPAWTPEEDARLAAAYAKGERIDHVAHVLSRTVKATYSRAKKIGLTHPRDIKGGFITRPTWSEAEDALLRELYGEIPTKELPGRIGRSLRSIYSRAFELDLKHGYQRQWSRTELKALKIGHERGLAIADVAAALDRNAFSVSKYATNRGYSFGRRPLLAAPITIEAILLLGGDSAQLPPVRGAEVLAAAEERKLQRALDAEQRRRSARRFAEERKTQRALEAEQRRGQIEAARAAAKAARDQARTAERERLAAARRADKKPVREVEKATARQAARPAPSREPALPAAKQARAHQPSASQRMEAMNRRRSTAIRQATIAKAEAFLDAGQSATREKGVHVVIAMRAVEAQRAEQARLACPIEQAKLVLQRKGRVVHSMAVWGGASDRYFVTGLGKDVTAEQLIAEAERFAA